jgi:hypothetical protein
MYYVRRIVKPADLLAADASLGTNKIGVWGLRPQRVQGRALALTLLIEPSEVGRPGPSIPRAASSGKRTVRRQVRHQPTLNKDGNGRGARIDNGGLTL